MILTLYTTKDNDNVINKNIVEKIKYNISMKNGVNISNPTIKIRDKQYDVLLSCNYCYIDELNRFYFIRDIIVETNDLFSLYLECDVLESYREDILNSVAEYYVNVGVDDYTNFNNVVDIRKDIDIYKSNKSIELGSTTLLTTIGGVSDT